jgi:hypothetical protein
MGGDPASSDPPGTFETKNGKSLRKLRMWTTVRERWLIQMNAKYLRIGIAAASLGLVSGWPIATRAQAPAGPLPAAQPQGPSSPEARPQEQAAPVKPRTSILGAWKLNRDESDDARKKMQEARGSDNGRGGGGRGGVRMGIPGMGGGPYGGGRRGGGAGAGGNESEDNRQKMEAVVNPAQSLTVAEATKVEIDMFDEQERKSAFYTDGRKLQKTKDGTSQEIAAHWDGKRLVTDEKTPSGRKMSRTYELSYDGRELYETLHLTRGRSDTTISIRYVYDQAEARNARAAQTRQ